MKLADLLALESHRTIPDCDILGLHNDSRQIKPGYLFVAYPGAAVDGRLFCQQAILSGAVAVAYEPEQLPESFIQEPHIIYVPVPQLAKKLAVLACRFYQDPTTDLSVTAITGTNGKTTIAYQLAQAHALLGSKARYIGTLGQGDVEALESVGNTTPDALRLQSLFHHYKEQGTAHVCMEVSSHALAQQRVANIHFTQAIYTNLSHEHLDYHKTMQDYAHAKAMLFAMPSLQSAVINFDDAYSQLMMAALPAACKAFTYGLQDGADVRAVNVHISMQGSAFDVISPWGTHGVRVKTLGAFNIYNSLAVFTSLMAWGRRVDDVVAVMAQLTPSPGRMELVAHEPCVIVDYAHTPDALENVLTTLVQLKKGLLWVVFGCGGDRDRAKRPMMGRIASEHADRLILTSDNPRSETPTQILADIAQGVLPRVKAEQIVDREEAIKYALQYADKQDIILIAGKGHESYQQIGTKILPFSDQCVVRDLIRSLTPL